MEITTQSAELLYPLEMEVEIDPTKPKMHFNFVKQIGEGSFGIVYLYKSSCDLGFKIAVKIQKAKQASFTNEAYYLNLLQKHNLTHVPKFYG